ncbi:MAG: DUF1611 domain-containing protein [Gemmatimonadetes bacterium]|nr:DUF1611 domain-containing protein [Gemmatimonadota bacterium]
MNFSDLRFLVLAEGKFGPLSSKTANGVIRYTPGRCVAVLDSTQAGRTAQEVIGFGGALPVVGTFEAGLAHKPNALLIGIAPQGGQLPQEWRGWIRQAIEQRLEVWSGLHFFIGDDAEFGPLAKRLGVPIHDLRKPPADLPISTGRVRDVAATVVLTVGADCNIGKMTASLQLRDGLKGRGRKVAFAGTGQTGILIEGWGIGVDAVVADFVGGASERLVLDAARGNEIVLVEGQGSLIHPGYSAVTYGLIHGSLPHAFVLCTQPSRQTVDSNEWVRIPPIRDLIALHEAVIAPLRPAPVIALSLNTFDLSDAAARDAIARAADESGLPATDPVRYDPAPIVEAVDAFHRARTG